MTRKWKAGGRHDKEEKDERIRRRKRMDSEQVTYLKAVIVNWPYCLAKRC